jgi:hypothetical protein
MAEGEQRSEKRSDKNEKKMKKNEKNKRKTEKPFELFVWSSRSEQNRWWGDRKRRLRKRSIEKDVEKKNEKKKLRSIERETV